MIAPIPAVAAMASYPLADPAPEGAISLAQNESAFPPSPRALAAGAAALARGALYPDADWSDLRAAIAAVHDVSGESILCGAGSMELIGAVIRAFSGPGDEVLGSRFGYLFVATACRQSGARYVCADETDYTVCVDSLLRSVGADTRIVFVCNPANPTGTRIANAEIIRLRAGLPARVLLVVDQAYGEFDDQDARPVFDLVAGGGTVVLRSFSKAYGLAGARVGWGLFPPAIGVEARKLLNPNNVGAVSQAMAAAAMRDGAHMRAIVTETRRAREALAATLRTAGFAPPRSHTNFLLIPFASPRACRAADRSLRAEGLLLRGMDGYGLGHCLRVTIGPAEAMARVAARLCAGGPAFPDEGGG
ncbi:histidinol-phosphate aminotransferase/N-methylhydantoinase B [Angulomicrobium tetraedrale]|uniref:Aminotransferase n=1 Tax=Ancylobacter tetraedralis TaxID=217068 RepID=A0A839Z877_9HYPH|nr:histidinol-phosphate transaminase [Ancylobacter tetraedralis]MBB3770365.1 histidinol-phosphate aminotransferase/N-methylhydantoinase B [Ancylobacter tetraedralis]